MRLADGVAGGVEYLLVADGGRGRSIMPAPVALELASHAERLRIADDTPGFELDVDGNERFPLAAFDLEGQKLQKVPRGRSRRSRRKGA